MNNKSVLSILLIIAGGWILLKLLGVTLGPIVGFLFSLLLPLILIGLGFVGMKNGKTLIGGIMLAVGALMLLGKVLHALFPLLVIGLIVWGVYMLVRKDGRRSF